MKTCQNCRCVYADDYNGKCQDCGHEMGSMTGSNQGAMGFQFARQTQSGLQESQQERALSRGNYANLRIEERLMEVAKAGAYLLEKAAGKDVSSWEE